MELPGVSGQVVCRAPAPLCSDIMGPIKCQHGILSMAALQTYREFCRKIGKGGLPPLDGQRKIEQELNALENGAFS